MEKETKLCKSHLSMQNICVAETHAQFPLNLLPILPCNYTSHLFYLKAHSLYITVTPQNFAFHFEMISKSKQNFKSSSKQILSALILITVTLNPVSNQGAFLVSKLNILYKLFYLNFSILQ